jgi:hypothetical protein
MLNNKLKTIGITLGAVLLVGCSDIIATPTDNETNILSNLITDLEKNVNSVVFDALRDNGTINQKTLDDVLVLLAEDKFGVYSTLVESSDGDDQVFVERVERRINEKMYNLIASGQFETRNLFSERRFAFSIEKQLFSLIRQPNSPWVENFVFPPRNTEDILSGAILEEAIHIEYYSNYIEGVLIPQIYRELLVEEYLLTEDYSSLGRSYARNVNFIGLKVSSENPEAIKYLMDTFIDEFILNDSAPSNADLELLAAAWRGIDENGLIFTSTSDEFALLKKAGLLDFQNGTSYQKGDTYKTLYGEILKQYERIDINPLLTDKAIEDEFTGNGQYSREIGLELKRRELLKRDFTTDGWHIKNGGLGSLPGTIRDRVFNIGVANAIDSIDDEITVIQDPVTNDFLRKINGVSYLIPQSSQQNDDRNFLLFDAPTSTYFIVQVLEAVNTTKMNASSTSTKNYDFLTGSDAKRLDIASEIAKILGVRESTTNASTIHWLRTAELKFHDQDIYDFFKERYPDLYDSESED